MSARGELVEPRAKGLVLRQAQDERVLDRWTQETGERGLYEASFAAHEMVGSLYYRLRGWR